MMGGGGGVYNETWDRVYDEGRVGVYNETWDRVYDEGVRYQIPEILLRILSLFEARTTSKFTEENMP